MYWYVAGATLAGPITVTTGPLTLSSGQLLLPDGTATAPSLAFTNDTNNGLYYIAADSVAVSAGGGIAGWFKTALSDAGRGIVVGPGGLAFNTSNTDTYLTRDAANTLALRNSTNAQTFNIYNTYTDASNYSRLALYANTSAYFEIAAQTAGSGEDHINVRISPAGAGTVILANTAIADGNNGSLRSNANDSQFIGLTSNQWQTAYLSRSIQGSKSKALTESAATTFVTVAVPQTAGANYAGGDVIYTVYATDATDHQALSGRLQFSAINKAGTVTATVTDLQQAAEAASSGTLTAAFTATTSGDNIILQCNAVSSLTQSTLTIQYRLDMPQPNTVTPA